MLYVSSIFAPLLSINMFFTAITEKAIRRYCARAASICCVLLFCLPTRSAVTDTTFVYLHDGGMDVYPSDVATVGELTDEGLQVRWGDGTIINYAVDAIDHIGHEGPADLPRLTSFKVNNKYNHQVFTDVEGEIKEHEVGLCIGCIGKWLTPSFKVSDEDASVYVGDSLQRSKVSRLHFDHDIIYTVALPDMRILRRHEEEGASSYTYAMQPYGRDYTVHVEWLTDQSENVPAIYINTLDGQMISSKNHYVDAEITIDGAGVYPSLETTPMQIKGRGNTSWSSNPWHKNPYRLKFAEKVKPFGMTKGKSWVLLANSLYGSLMTNAIGMEVASLTGTAAANHIIPVELYINGHYRGNYNFTEKVGFSNNSIDIEDETDAVLLELDTYYDETYKFKSTPYNLPVNIKEPDFGEGETSLTTSDIITDFNQVMRTLKNGTDIADLVDMEYLARYMLVSELIENFELMHPKSTFLYKEHVKGESKYIFGPIWDLDWGFGYELYYNYCVYGQEVNYFNSVRMEARQFVWDLRYVSEQLDRVYYKVWTHFMTYHLDELLDYCSEYFAYANPSFQNNQDKWGDGNQYATFAYNAKKWLQRRANHVYSHLTVYDLTDEELNPDTGIIMAETVQNHHGRWPSGSADVYNLHGQCVKRHVSVADLRKGLAPGIYIVNGKKMVIKN